MKNKITHAELIEYGRRWLYRRNCGYVAAEECGLALEQPDLLGFRSGFTIMIEVKISRRDFKRDALKFFRTHPRQGVGNYRYYLCPEGVIKPSDIPSQWGLIHLRGKRLHIVSGPKTFQKSHYEWWQESNLVAENQIMYSVLRKAHREGLL